ncbi:MAG: hypothetical protein MUF18_21735 [Fimbriiglobus sp.]|jgi:DNA-binding NarL/FixJ family response regulator|nr:hypothetical protein [Fimbriiglobus sp.]
MKYPRVVVWAFDGWLASQLREAITERRWVMQTVNTPAEWRKATATACVAVIQADPTAADNQALTAVSELHRGNPDADVVVVCDMKLNDDDRPPWTAAALDLGARLVLYPPLTKVVLEDAVLGLMERRFGVHMGTEKEEAIDLAEGNFEAE